jgi:cytochrome c oxidase subunit IV
LNALSGGIAHCLHTNIYIYIYIYTCILICVNKYTHMYFHRSYIKWNIRIIFFIKSWGLNALSGGIAHHVYKNEGEMLGGKDQG